MNTGITDTRSNTFHELLGNGKKFEIPKYQRDYSWDSEQWSDLWYDFDDAIKNKESHYMGYLVLQTSNNKNFAVIDGQQRLITICIILLSIIKILENLPGSEEEIKANKQRADLIRTTYIGELDMLTLVPENKLSLNRNNDKFYRQFLVPLLEMPKRGLKASEKLLKKSFEFFSSNIKKRYKTYEDLIMFKDVVTEQLFFTVITVSDELNAFKVFETLNARGVQLTSSDLLKNYLFSVADSGSIHATQIEALEDLWSHTIDILGDKKISEYLRIFWNSYHKTVRKSQLYRAIRDNIKTPEQAFTLLRNLQKKADLYIAIQNPFDEYWEGNEKIKEYLSILKIFYVTQPYSLLLTGNAVLSTNEFEKLLHDIVVVSFRYNIICGKNPNEQETKYNTLALEIIKTKKYTSDTLISTQLYISDKEFEQTFAYKEFVYNSRNMKIVKYILRRIEHFKYATNIDESRYTVEHILPVSPDEEKWDWEDGKVQQFKNRLGNMTLLSSKKNKEIGNSGFLEKKEIFKYSKVDSTKELGESQLMIWTESSIEERQKKLAKEAVGIWKIG